MPTESVDEPLLLNYSAVRIRSKGVLVQGSERDRGGPQGAQVDDMATRTIGARVVDMIREEAAVDVDVQVPNDRSGPVPHL